MEIAYAAFTDSCVFMLDDDGICRWVVTRGSKASPKTIENAQRCIGAQYVASLDLDSDGGLTPAPKIGAPMLFAFVGTDGRIALVRSGAVVKFEDRRRGAAPAYAQSAPTLPNDATPTTATESGEYVTPVEAERAVRGGSDGEDDDARATELTLERLELDLDGESDQERTLQYRGKPRRVTEPGGRTTMPSPFGHPLADKHPASRMTLHPTGGSAVPPPQSGTSETGGSSFAHGDGERCVTGRYLPIQARALRHLARLKK